MYKESLRIIEHKKKEQIIKSCELSTAPHCATLRKQISVSFARVLLVFHIIRQKLEILFGQRISGY